MKTAETPKYRLKLVEIALLIGLAVFLVSGGLALRAQEQLSERVVRLHVLANSDGEEDQALKLKVRDRVLARATELLTQAKNRAEAESLLRAALPELETLAAGELRANGCDYPVRAELTDTEFPTRAYDGFTLPAGEYLALRVMIGEGAGRNWWCVVFPPLCTAASADVPAAALAAGLTEDQVSLITEEDQGYVLKLKAVEWWEEIRARLEGPED
nr:stage II sporulation protein R [uncultured Oscillibacter sp.]